MYGTREEKKREERMRHALGTIEYDKRKREKNQQRMHTQKLDLDGAIAENKIHSQERQNQYQEEAKNNREIFKANESEKSEQVKQQSEREKNNANIQVSQEKHRESLNLARANFETTQSLSEQSHHHGLKNKKEDLKNELIGLFAKSRIDKSRDQQNNQHSKSMQFQEHRNHQEMQKNQYNHESGMQNQQYDHESNTQKRDISSQHHMQEKSHQHDQMAQVREIDNQQTQKINQYKQEQFIQAENHYQEQQLQDQADLQSRFLQSSQHNHELELQEEERETYAHNEKVDTIEHGNRTAIDLRADARRSELYQENKTHDTFCNIAEKITDAKCEVWIFEKKLEIARRFSKVENEDIDDILRKNKDKWDSEL